MASDIPTNDFTHRPSTEGTDAGGEPNLQHEISKLRDDLAGVADAVKALASNRANNARGQAFALRDDVRERGEEYIRQAQEAANDLEEQLSEKIRTEPIKSVLIATAIGYLYARIFH